MKKLLLVSVVALASYATYQVNAVERVVEYIDMASLEALAQNENEEDKCRWSQMSCPKTDYEREVCLTDGNGGSCSCGAVTRPCP